MARLFIPEEDIERIQKLINLGDKLTTDLVNALTESPPGIWGDKLAGYITENTEIEQNDAKDISRLIYSLSINKRFNQTTIDEFIDGLVIGVKKADEKIDLSEKLIKVIQQILSIESVIFTAKAAELELEREKAVSDFRIITDLRPIFDDDNPDIIKSFLIVHNLKIKYRDYSDTYESYFSVDEVVLQKLKDHIIRALNKSKRIKKGIGDINIINLDYE